MDNRPPSYWSADSIPIVGVARRHGVSGLSQQDGLWAHSFARDNNERQLLREGYSALMPACTYSFFTTSSRSHRGHHDPGIACKKRPTANPAIPLPMATHPVIAAPCFGLLRRVGRVVAS
jgi:hypothetical protein